MERRTSITEAITRRSLVTTYKALDTKNNSTVIIKVIPKKEETTSLRSELNRLTECNSEFLIKTLSYLEREEAYWVQNRLPLNRIGCDGV